MTWGAGLTLGGGAATVSDAKAPCRYALKQNFLRGIIVAITTGFCITFNTGTDALSARFA